MILKEGGSALLNHKQTHLCIVWLIANSPWAFSLRVTGKVCTVTFTECNAAPEQKLKTEAELSGGRRSRELSRCPNSKPLARWGPKPISLWLSEKPGTWVLQTSQAFATHGRFGRRSPTSRARVIFSARPRQKKKTAGEEWRKEQDRVRRGMEGKQRRQSIAKGGKKKLLKRGLKSQVTALVLFTS